MSHPSKDQSVSRQSELALPDDLDLIEILGIEFHGRHGVPEAERAIGHQYRVDLGLYLSTGAAARDDDVQLTVDYAKVVEAVLEIGRGESVKLIETLAGQIAADLLVRFPQVERLIVTVAKPRPPVDLPVGECRVTVRRSRPDPAPAD